MGLAWANQHVLNNWLTPDQVMWLVGALTGAHAVNAAANTVPIKALGKVSGGTQGG